MFKSIIYGCIMLIALVGCSSIKQMSRGQMPVDYDRVLTQEQIDKKTKKCNDKGMIATNVANQDESGIRDVICYGQLQ